MSPASECTHIAEDEGAVLLRRSAIERVGDLRRWTSAELGPDHRVQPGVEVVVREDSASEYKELVPRQCLDIT
jgi:hypothetical protein